MDDDTRTWHGVIAHIEEQLVTGELRVGDHLPSERTLATELGVARSSVREALRALETLGLIHTQNGSGPSSGAVIITQPAGGLNALLRLHVASSSFPVSDIIETRIVLERFVVGTLASGHHTSASSAPGLAPALVLLDEMDTPGLTRREFLTIDARFHCTLAEATGNTLIASLMAGIRSGIERYVLRDAETLTDWNTIAVRLRHEHRAIVTAIQLGNVTEAQTLVSNHIIRYHNDVASPSQRTVFA